MLLEQQTAAASASLILTAFSSTYDEYLIEILGLTPTTTSTTLRVHVSTDGGSTWLNTGYQFVSTYTTPSGGAPSTDANAAASAFQPVGATDLSSATAAVTGSMRFYSAMKRFLSELGFMHTNGQAYVFRSAGWVSSGSAVTALRFMLDSGTIASGTVRLYGVAKS